MQLRTVAFVFILSFNLLSCKSTQKEITPTCNVNVSIFENLSHNLQSLKEGLSLQVMAEEVMRQLSPTWLSLKFSQELNQNIEISFVKAYAKNIPGAVSGNIILKVSSDANDNIKYLRGLAVKGLYWSVPSEKSVLKAAFEQSYASILEEIEYYCYVRG